MQFEYRLKKYLKKKAENNWVLNTDPAQKKYTSFYASEMFKYCHYEKVDFNR